MRRWYWTGVPSFLWISGAMPGLNELIQASGVRRAGAGHRTWNGYAKMKREVGQRVALLARAQGFAPPAEGGFWTYLFVERDRRRDPSNFVAGGVKIIEDALQGLGLIRNDGWQNVSGMRAFWRVDRMCPGVAVAIGSHECDLATMEELRGTRIEGNGANRRLAEEAQPRGESQGSGVPQP